MKKILRNRWMVWISVLTLAILGIALAGDVVVKEGEITADTATIGSGNGSVDIGANSDGWGELLLGGPTSHYHYQLNMKGKTPGVRQEIVRTVGFGYAFSLFDLKARNSEGLADVGQVGSYGSVDQNDLPESKYIYMGANSETAWNNAFVKIDADNKLGLGLPSSNRPNYPLHVATEVEGVSIYASSGISGDELIDRTSIFNKSKNVWDYIRDADYYLTDGEIDHGKFYGYVSYIIRDYSRPVVVSPGDGGDDLPIYDYPYNKIEEGVSLGAEISVLRQAVYELKQENDTLKAELAKIKAAVGVK